MSSLINRHYLLVLIFFLALNLWTGSPIPGFDGIPKWNQISEDHIKSSLVVANAMMDDMGWVLVITSPAHLFLLLSELLLGQAWLLDFVGL